MLIRVGGRSVKGVTTVVSGTFAVDCSPSTRGEARDGEAMAAATLPAYHARHYVQRRKI